MVDPVTAAVQKIAISTASSAILGSIKSQIALRGSEYGERFGTPDAERLLDETFRLLAHDATTLPSWISQSFRALLSQRPESFALPEARIFIGDGRVVQLGKDAVRLTLRGLDADPLYLQASEIYHAMFYEDGGFGIRLLEDAVAFAAKSLLATLSAGDRTMLDLLRGDLADLRQIVEQIASQAPVNVPRLSDARAFNVPTAAKEMVGRENMIAGMIALLGNRTNAGAAFIGSGGAGKTTAAIMVADHPDTLAAFPDGVFWISLGQSPDIARLQGVWLNFLAERPLAFSSVEAATAFLREHFRRLRALLIIDDVWTGSDLAAFAVGGAKCATLITTRDRAVAAGLSIVEMDALEMAEAVQLLRLRGQGRAYDDADLQAVATALDCLPLALELAAYQLDAGMSATDLIAALSNEAALIHSLAIPVYGEESDTQVARNQSLDACLNLSVRRLPSDLLQCFAELSVLRQNSVFDQSTVAPLCGIDLPRAGAALRQLRAMSLVEEVRVGTDNLIHYRMHSVVRAKAHLSLVEAAATGDPDQAVRDALLRYLKRRNLAYPDKWHAIGEDAHLIDNLIYYLVRIEDDSALLSLLITQTPPPRLANCWHDLRLGRGQDEIFGIDVRDIFAYFAGRDGATRHAFVGLIEARLALASVTDMNRGIDSVLCLALLDAGLWSPGQVSAHASRRFRPGEIALVALRLPEPFRSTTLRNALAMAVRAGPDPDVGAQLVRAAQAFDGPARRDLIQITLEMLEEGLSGGRESYLTPSGEVRSNRVALLRIALAIECQLSAEVGINWPIDRWVDTFLSAFEHPDLPIDQGKIAFDTRDSNPSAALIETLLFLISYRDETRAKRALVLAERLLYERLDQSAALARQRFVFHGITAPNDDATRQAAIDTLKVADPFEVFEPGLHVELATSDGIEGTAALLATLYGDDPDFLRALGPEATATPLLMAFVQHCLKRSNEAPLIEALSTLFGDTIERLARTGSVVPEGQDFRLTRAHLRIVTMLAGTDLAKRVVTWVTIESDLDRVSGDVDRFKLLELFLPHLGRIDPDAAYAFCRRFSHTLSAASAWLALGGATDEEARDEFLENAIPLLALCEPTEALDALSRFIPRYLGAHARELGRSAAALAAGIGDVDAMRHQFARASLTMEQGRRAAAMNADFWFLRDTMPTHAELPPIPRSRALLCPPFWATDFPDSSIEGVPSAANIRKLDDDQYFTWVMALIGAAMEEPLARGAVAKELADLAQEFALRDRGKAPVTIAEAIQRAAAMYR